MDSFSHWLFNKWVKEIPTKKETQQVIMEFMLNQIIWRFGVPAKFIADNAMSFRAKYFVEMCKDYGLNLTYASDYNSQGNGQDKSNNKNLLKINRRTLEMNKKKWGEKLKFVV